MKKIFLIPFIAMIAACNCQKQTNESNQEKKITSTSQCPDDGKCSIEIKEQKSLNVKTDEFGSTYYELVDDKTTSVIIYKYIRNTEEGLQDSNYREEIVFETDNANTVSLKNNDLQQTKMLFGRFCFCRGQTGYYKVTNGNLQLTNKGNKLDFNLNFTVSQVPQIINSIEYAIIK